MPHIIATDNRTGGRGITSSAGPTLTVFTVWSTSKQREVRVYFVGSTENWHVSFLMKQV